ncbi:mitochondrial ribonuclease P protein 1 homolog [Ceratina calcarata]|uniref:RNA (guanine-9-)-methyltransferase domain-containing protein 1 n=1 Tax=Ceratina calcarata TaxID=156304 RepID=A0AAJ7J8N0_9HYME|nr:mitochondrial ribonuclease P protein 1 homolog [Ceratina calcarata]
MYNRVCISFFNAAHKLYSNTLVHSLGNNIMVPRVIFAVQTTVRGYCNINPTYYVDQAYDQKYQEQLAKLLEDPEYKAVYDKCKLEIEFLKVETQKVPEQFKAYDWLHLIRTKTKTQRRVYVEHLWKIERKEENRIRKRELKLAEGEPEIRKDDDSPYGLSKCSMFYRIREKTMVEFDNSRLINAMLHEPTVVFDLGYEEYMAPYELTNTAKQLLLSFSLNRAHDQPFNLYFCNIIKDSLVMEKLHKTIPQLYNPEFPLNITSKSYLEIFDKKKLVYLTPHTNKTMTEYDPNLIYIIGAMVDKTNPKPFSFQKANREGIKMMKFPLGERLEWGTGSRKNLPINQVLSILLDLRHTNDWNAAFDHIPKRKLRQAREDAIEKLIVKRQMQLKALGEK